MSRKAKSLLMFFLGAFATSAAGEQLAVNFILTPPTPTQNTLPITVSASIDTGFPFGTLSDSDSDTSTFSGNMLANLDLSFDAAGSVTSLNTLAFTGGRVQFDDDLLFQLSYAFGLASVNASASNLAGVIQTPLPPAPITGNSFSLALHTLTINEGTLVATGSGLADDVNQTTRFDTAAITAPLNGTATISVQLDQVLGPFAYYTATVTAPFSYNNALDISPEISASVATAGTFVAQASFSRPLLTPGDTDGDSDIDDADLGNLLANYTGPDATGKTPSDGDTDYDGDIDDSDLGTAFASYTGPIAPPTVPEPTTLILSAIGGSVALLRRR